MQIFLQTNFQPAPDSFRDGFIHIKHLPGSISSARTPQAAPDIFHCVHLSQCRAIFFCITSSLSHVWPLRPPPVPGLSQHQYTQYPRPCPIFSCAINSFDSLNHRQRHHSRFKTLISKNGFPRKRRESAGEEFLLNQFPPPSVRGNLILSRCPIHGNLISSQLNSHLHQTEKRSVRPNSMVFKYPVAATAFRLPFLHTLNAACSDTISPTPRFPYLHLNPSPQSQSPNPGNKFTLTLSPNV